MTPPPPPPPPPPSPHTIVRASAGSGKTYTLTNRFIERLLAGEDPSGMLATTFTRAAAGEILHRVLGRLSAAVINDQSLNDLGNAINNPRLTHEQCAEILTNLTNQLHRLSIMTIDSFFSRLAGSFSFELGLPMQYRLLEEDEDEHLKELSVDEAINACSSDEMVELLRSLQGDRIQMQTHSAIMRSVKAGYNMYLATNADPSPWNSIQPVGESMDDPDLDAACEQLAQAQIPLTKAGAPNQKWTKAQSRCLEFIQNRDWDSFVKGGLGKPIVQSMDSVDVPTFSKIEFTDELLEILWPIVQHARHVLSSDHINRTHAVFKLMARFDHAYRNAKMASGQLSFDDPPRLLNESQVTGDLEHLYYRLDASIRHVMLDEFQDTSMPQFKLLEPILDELLSQNEDGRSVFVVGDIKQSLYTWRQAEPALLGAMTERWDTFEQESLAKSWRSSPIVLDLVNAVFGDLPNNDAINSKAIGQQAAVNWNQQYETHIAAKPDLPGFVRLSVADGDEESNLETTEEVLWACAQRVADARAHEPNASIAVLVRQGQHIYPLLSKLTQLGVDACEDRGNPLVDAPSVAAAVSMLELIDHPSNSAALYHVRSTPLGDIVGLNNPKSVNAVASDLRERIANQGCVPMLTDWLKACAGSMDQRGFTRFEQLIELAGRLHDQGRTGPAILAMVANTRKIDEPGAAPVRVMTIHGSKGLEFDMVVLPLLGQPWSVRSDSILSMRDDPLGPITCATRYPKAQMQAVHPGLKTIHDHAMLGQINEELCCLYVAMTRAKSALELIVPADAPGRKNQALEKFSLRPAHVIRAALAPDLPALPAATLYESSSDRDWADDIQSTPATPTPEPQPVTLAIRAPKKLRAGQLMSAAPSSEHEPTTLHASELLKDTSFGQSARDHGQCVHAAFEFIDWIDHTNPNESQLIELLAIRGHGESESRKAIDELTAALENESIQRLLNQAQWLADHPSANEVAVYHERPFAVRIGKPGQQSSQERLLQGQIDRLIIGSNNNQTVHAQIVDYKTDRDAQGLDADRLAELATKHQPQMNAYRQAVAAMYGLDESAIQVTLIFTAAPGLVNL